MPAHKHAELIKAWADGAEIECKGGLYYQNWEPVSQPNWSNSCYDFRIKPIPDPYAELKAAYLAGKDIEFRSPLGWLAYGRIELPRWSSPVSDYRIKPEDIVFYEQYSAGGEEGNWFALRKGVGARKVKFTADRDTGILKSVELLP